MDEYIEILRHHVAENPPNYGSVLWWIATRKMSHRSKSGLE